MLTTYSGAWKVTRRMAPIPAPITPNQSCSIGRRGREPDDTRRTCTARPDTGPSRVPYRSGHKGPPPRRTKGCRGCGATAREAATSELLVCRGRAASDGPELDRFARCWGAAGAGRPAPDEAVVRSSQQSALSQSEAQSSRWSGEQRPLRETSSSFSAEITLIGLCIAMVQSARYQTGLPVRRL